MFLLFVVACQKDFDSELVNSSPQNDGGKANTLTMPNAKHLFNSNVGSTERDSIAIAGVTPLWDAAVNSRYAGQVDILIVPIEPPTDSVPGAGANLIFYLNQDSILDYIMLVHVPTPEYLEESHGKLSPAHFTGALLSVSKTGKIGDATIFENGTLIGIDSVNITAYLVPDPGCGTGCYTWGGPNTWSKIWSGAVGLWHSIINGTGNGIIIVGGNIGLGGVEIIPPGSGLGTGGGGTPVFSGYFNLDLFEGVERMNRQLINQFRDKFCMIQTSQSLLLKLADCGLSVENEEDLYMELKQLTQNYGNISPCIQNIITEETSAYFQQLGFTVSITQLEQLMEAGSNSICAIKQLTESQDLDQDELNFLLSQPLLMMQMDGFLQQYDSSPSIQQYINALLRAQGILLNHSFQVLKDLYQAFLDNPNSNQYTYMTIPMGSSFQGDEGQGTTILPPDNVYEQPVYTDCNTFQYQTVGPGGNYQACGVSGLYIDFLYLYFNSNNELEVGVYKSVLSSTWYFEYPRITFDGDIIYPGEAANQTTAIFETVEDIIEVQYRTTPPKSNFEETQLQNDYINKLKNAMQAVGGRFTKTNNYNVSSHPYHFSPWPTDCN